MYYYYLIILHLFSSLVQSVDLLLAAHPHRSARLFRNSRAGILCRPGRLLDLHRLRSNHLLLNLRPAGPPRRECPPTHIAHHPQQDLPRQVQTNHVEAQPQQPARRQSEFRYLAAKILFVRHFY